MEEKLFEAFDHYYEDAPLSDEEVQLLFFTLPIDEFNEYLNKYHESGRFKKITSAHPM